METKGYQLNEAGYWRIVASLGLASTFIFASFYSFQPLIPVFEKEFSISVTYSSLTMSLATLSLIFGLIVLGFFPTEMDESYSSNFPSFYRFFHFLSCFLLKNTG